MGDGWTNFVAQRLPELWLRIGEHVVLTVASTALAVLAGIPLGVLAYRARWLRGFLLGTAAVLQTIPSLAMLVILLVLLEKIGALPAIIALTLYALLPIVRNTVAGLEGVSDDISEAALGIGMTPRQQLWMVQLPMATPVMVAGIRTAAVAGVGIATLSAFIGAGGLGQFINRGLSLSNERLILLGAIPAAILALVVDGVIGLAEWGLRPLKQNQRRSPAAKLRLAAVCLPFVLMAAGIAPYLGSLTSEASSDDKTRPVMVSVRIATKNFTEQLILGELMAQLTEARTDLIVNRVFNLGGTMICHGALAANEIDLYAEYTGTALTAILKQDVIRDPDDALAAVRQAYRSRYDAEWLEPFGFNNTYAITVRKGDATRQRWVNISDLQQQAPELRAGFTAEFAERPDGYPGLCETYGFRFGQQHDLDAAIMYSAVAKDQVDVICAFVTDGRIAAYDLQPLLDDQRFFPPYFAAPVIRGEFLRLHPEIQMALAPLAGLLDDATMQRLNYEVDEKKRSPADVAREFLRSYNLLPDP